MVCRCWVCRAANSVCSIKIASQQEVEFMNQYTGLAKSLKIAFKHCSCPNSFHPVWVCMNACNALQKIDEFKSEVQEFLASFAGKKCHVFIAGAADERTLDLIAQNDAERCWSYTVADLCPAPLEMARELAIDKQIRLETVQGNISQIKPPELLDAVFVFSTFSFMSHEERVQFLTNVAKNMAPDGRIFCVVRYFETFPDESVDDAAEWEERTKRGALDYFSSLPELAVEIVNAVERLGATRVSRMKAQPKLDAIIDEARKVGFHVISQTDLERPWRPDKAGKLFVQQKKAVLILGSNV